MTQPLVILGVLAAIAVSGWWTLTRATEYLWLWIAIASTALVALVY